LSGDGAIEPVREISIAVEPEGLLIEGEPDEVEEYVAHLRRLAGESFHESSVDSATVGAAAGYVAGAASVARQSGRFVMLSQDSLKALKAARAIPGDAGYFRMMTRGAGGRFVKQLQWKPTSLSPQRMASIQLIAVQMALTSAIAQVDESVQRVEGKVDAVLKLAEAERFGDVVGHHTSLDRLIRYLDSHGTLPDALWESVASLGPALEAVVEKLRNHFEISLRSVPADGSVSERAKRMRRVLEENRIIDTLHLLLVAQDSLFKWQRLLIARVVANEPEHREQVIEATRELLAHQVQEDGRLYRVAKSAIEQAASRTELDGFRYPALRRLTEDRERLRHALDDFARARRRQAEQWEHLEVPTPLRAVSATVDMALEGTSRALSNVGQQLIDFGGVLANRRRRHEPEPRIEQTGTQ